MHVITPNIDATNFPSNMCNAIFVEHLCMQLFKQYFHSLLLNIDAVTFCKSNLHVIIVHHVCSYSLRVREHVLFGAKGLCVLFLAFRLILARREVDVRFEIVGEIRFEMFLKLPMRISTKTYIFTGDSRCFQFSH